MKRSLYLIFLIMWMAFIFYMSSQTGSESSHTSGVVLKVLTKMGIDVNSAFGEMAHYVLRKGAHLFEYFILAILFYHNLKYYKMNAIQLVILCIGLTCLYACTDEFHQSFVPNRGASLIDVLIDTTGGTIGIGCVYLFRKMGEILNMKSI
jgi:VanZ family protein